MGGDPDETISSRCGKIIVRKEKTGKSDSKFCKFCSILCYYLRKIDPNHCRKSIEADEGSREV